MLLPFCLLVALASISALVADDFENEWNLFMFRFRRYYKNHDELMHRKNIFRINYEEVHRHNLEYEQGLHSYRKGINQYSDYTMEELRESFLLKTPFERETEADTFNDDESPVPDQIDYRTLGVVTPIKDQGHCRSCWAFSAVAAIESQYALSSKNLTSFSEQELVDCSESNGGCRGGDAAVAFYDLKNLGGITTEYEYPYIAEDQKCQLTPKMPKLRVLGYKKVASNEKALKQAVALKGPISVAIDVTDNFRHYKNGIFEDSSCNSFCNHVVLVVGYGTDNTTGKDYWIVKNSWSARWGEKGYIRMVRNSDKNCQIASEALYPIVEVAGSSL